MIDVDMVKFVNTKNNKAVRKMLHDEIHRSGRCAYVDCSDCALKLNFDKFDEHICLLIYL